MLRGLNLRRTGWILAIFGIGGGASFLLASAWLSRKNDTAFNMFVGWANIASVTISAIGVILVMVDKVGDFANLSSARVAGIADDVAREAMRQDGVLLAQLLSTDQLDNRAARGNFLLGKPHGRQNLRGKRSTSSVREFAGIVDVYLSETRRRMVILGGPGTGKTVLAASLTVGLLKRRAVATANRGQINLIPCLFNLPSWDPQRHDLADWLEMQMVDRFRLGRKVAARLVHDGWVLPVLDGLDEMDSQDASPYRSQSAVSRINDYVARTPDCEIVVVCRSGTKYYERLARRVRNADEITVQNLTPAQIVDYIKTQCPDESSVNAWQSVFDALKSRDSSPVLSQLDTPWRLTAAVTFGLFGGDPATLLPAPAEKAISSWHSDYSDRISKLLMETFITNRILIHRKRRISPAVTTLQLRIIANMLAKMEQSGDGGKEIILHQWWRAFNKQKILRAQGTTAWVVLHFPIVVLLLFWWSTYSSGHHKGSFAITAILMNYITISFYCIVFRIPKAKGPTAFRIDSLRSRRVSLITGAAVVFSGALGFVSALVGGTWYGIGSGISFATLNILIVASAGLGSDPMNATRPVGVLSNDRNFAIIVGVAIGAYATLYYVTIYGLPAAVALASVCVLGSILSSAYMRYLVSVCFGRRKGLPLRFSSFLDWCHSAGILRFSGVGYQFRHQELIDYLTRQ